MRANVHAGILVSKGGVTWGCTYLTFLPTPGRVRVPGSVRGAGAYRLPGVGAWVGAMRCYLWGESVEDVEVVLTWVELVGGVKASCVGML